MSGLDRKRALMANCPKCGARAGAPCIGKRELRKAPHRTRFTAQIVPVRTAAPLKLNRPVVVGFYQSDEWRHVRYQALKKHGGACQCCGTRAARDAPLHVDHIKPRSKFPELALDLNNLQVLCADCNLGKRAWDQTDWRKATS